MSDKEEVLNQLNDIHSSLVDQEKFVPYNYDVLIMWGVISAILFLTFDVVAKLSIWYSVTYIGVVLAIGFLVEIYFIKKENIKYDLEVFTKTQTFIETIFTFSIIFSIVLTYIFISNSLDIYGYLAWIFLLGFAVYVTGFILNNSKFALVGIINISVSLAIFVFSFIFDPVLFASYVKYVAVLFSSGGFIYLGISIKKEYAVV